MQRKSTKKQIKNFKKQRQYPRKTKNWLRYRQQSPNKFSKFRIKKISPTRQLVVGKLKKSGKWIVQSIMKKRKIQEKLRKKQKMKKTKSEKKSRKVKKKQKRS